MQTLTVIFSLLLGFPALATERDPEQCQVFAEYPRTFEVEILSYYDELFRTAKRLTRSEPDAQDLLQSVYANALRKKNTFTKNETLRGWLHVSLANAWKNEIRRRVTHPEVSLEDWNNASALEVAETSVLLQNVLKTIDEKLTPEHRRILILAGLEHTYTEMSEKTFSSIGTVKSRLFRARARMMELMQEEIKNKEEEPETSDL